MGVSYYHDVYVICRDDQSSYNLSDRIGDIPVYDYEVNGNVIHFTSGGYGLFDLFHSEFPLPESWVSVSHRMYGCQGQDWDVVDWVGRDEIESIYEDVDTDENGECEYEPGFEYTDPTSDYWGENNHLNIYSQEPNFYEMMKDEDDEDEYQTLYDQWLDTMLVHQVNDLKKGLDIK